MKTDFSVHVHVDLGVTPELVALVTSIIEHRQMPTVQEPPASEQPAPAAPTPAKRRGRKAAEPTAPADADQGEISEAETQPEAEAPAQEAETAQPQQPAEADGPKELTEQDIRDAMNRTRQRIEGENYKDETDSESYQKYHRQLTAWFKNTAALFGSDKPSALIAEKGQDEARAFIAECDRLQIMEDGTIGIPEAF